MRGEEPGRKGALPSLPLPCLSAVILGLDPRIGFAACATLEWSSAPLRSILGSSPRMTAFGA